VLLRGVNVSNLESGVTPADLEALRDTGFNAIRLPLRWDLLEPAAGQIDEGYLAGIDNAVALAQAYAIYVVPDFHQWYWSVWGMPSWTCPLEPITDGGYLMECAEHFFASPDLCAAFVAKWALLAARYADAPAIAAFDIINEPPPPSMSDVLEGTFEKQTLFAFYTDNLAAIRGADPDRMVVLEPAITSLGGTVLPQFGPAFGNLVYSPHIYIPHGYQEGAGLVWLLDPSPDFVQDQYAMAVEAAAKLHMPLLIGEFGVQPDKEGSAGWLATVNALQDDGFLGSLYWDFKGGGWALFDDALLLKPFFLEHLLRPYVAAAAGEPEGMSALPWSGLFHVVLKVSPQDRCGITEVVLPGMLYPDGPDIHVSAAADYLYDPDAQRLYVRNLIADTTVEIDVQ
jgi:endoglycosylceramidase